MTSRDQFETRFPVPEGVTWNPETSRYVLTELRKSTVSTYEAHVERWVVWQAACESLRAENQRITPVRSQCLACGGYHEGLSGLPCPKMSPYSRVAS
jgi:hypothetical protein